MIWWARLVRLRELSVIRYWSTFGAITRIIRDMILKHVWCDYENYPWYDTGGRLVRLRELSVIWYWSTFGAVTRIIRDTMRERLVRLRELSMIWYGRTFGALTRIIRQYGSNPRTVSTNSFVFCFHSNCRRIFCKFSVNFLTFCLLTANILYSIQTMFCFSLSSKNEKNSLHCIE